MVMRLRNGSSPEADRFRLAMAIVHHDYELSPDARREADALAKRLESYHPSLTLVEGYPVAFSESPCPIPEFPAIPAQPCSRDKVRLWRWRERSGKTSRNTGVHRT